MNLTVKTLKGGKFTIEVDPSNTVAQVKTAIVSFDFPSRRADESRGRGRVVRSPTCAEIRLWILV